MWLHITFPGHNVDSHELYNDLRMYDVNVTDMGIVVHVYKNGITMNQINDVIAICEKHGHFVINEIASVRHN